MFEKIRIKEHMEVATSDGGHLGTVDEVHDDRIKLTRSDSSDGRHHYVALDSVDRIDDNRIYLKAGTSATHADGTPHAMADAGVSGGANIDRVTGEPMAPGAGATGNTAGAAASSTDTNYAARPGTKLTNDEPLFGTSGHGTGMGGSGVGN